MLAQMSNTPYVPAAKCIRVHTPDFDQGEIAEGQMDSYGDLKSNASSFNESFAGRCPNRSLRRVLL